MHDEVSCTFFLCVTLRCRKDKSFFDIADTHIRTYILTKNLKDNDTRRNAEGAAGAGIHTQAATVLRYVTLLLDISDESHQDFDELLLERNARGYWLHFAVRPRNNRRKIHIINVI